MRRLLALSLLIMTGFMVSEANALDEHGLIAIQTAVQQICVQPSQKGAFLKIEGDLTIGATLKIVGVDGAGKITKEDWDGISQRADQYKTDPRQCAVAITPILVAAMNAPDGSKGKPYPNAEMCPPNSLKFYDSEASYNGKGGFSFPKGAIVCFVRTRADHNLGKGVEIRDEPK